MEILNLSEDIENLNISEISPQETKKYNNHLLHSGKINKQVLNYIVHNTKISFEEIKKLFTFDFKSAENNKTNILINNVVLTR